MYLVSDMTVKAAVDKSTIEFETVFNKPRAKFRTALQRIGLPPNRNRRVYPLPIIERALKERVYKLISENSFLGELDHPVVPTVLNDEKDFIRQVTVHNKNASHLIRNITIDKNLIVGDLMTTSTIPGFNLAGLLYDGVNIGFSVRSIGNFIEKLDSNGKKYYEAAWPFVIITYDATSDPACEEARVAKIDISPSKLISSNQNMVAVLDALSPSLKKYFLEKVSANDYAYMDRYFEDNDVFRTITEIILDSDNNLPYAEDVTDIDIDKVMSDTIFWL